MEPYNNFHAYKKINCKQLFFSIILLVALSTHSFAQNENQLKKITITESNNHLLDKRFRTMDLPDCINTPAAIELRKYVLANGFEQASKDVDMILAALKWVSSQWTHDGNNAADNLTSLQILQNAKNGARYRCVEYGRVLSAVLRSFGFLSRPISMESLNSAYGAPGSGHFATEVWCDDLQKWIFIDPQFCIYTQYKGKFLNYYEMYLLKKEGKFNEIDFVLSKGYTGYLAQGKKTGEEHIKGYKEFLYNYFGVMKINGKVAGKPVTLRLLMEAPNQYLTFQAFSQDDFIHTANAEDIYFPLNQNTIIFKNKYTNKRADIYNDLVRQGKIKNEEDQFNSMYLFAPIPDFLIYNDSNMPWLSHYELWLNSTQIFQNENGFFEVSLKEGQNTISSVAINKNGKRGSETIVKIKYGNN
jgi:Transglutaminase-like superfamily